MSEDWKGEHLISAKPKSREERNFISLSAASGICHRRRQAKGCNASRSGGPWAKTIGRWLTQRTFERGVE